MITGALSWFFLSVWEVWIGDEPQHIAVGRFHVAVVGFKNGQATSFTPAHQAVLQSHADAFMSQELQRKAVIPVQMAHPELAPMEVKLRTSISIHKGTPVIVIFGKSARPAYLAALINELMSERIAELQREHDQSPSYRAYVAAVTPVLQAQRDVASLRRKLNSLPQEATPPPIRDAMQAELEDAESRWRLAKEALGQLPPEYEGGGYGIYDLVRSEPYEHAMDPLALIVHHPWRALASLAVAGLLSIFLIPRSHGASSRGTSAEVPA